MLKDCNLISERGGKLTMKKDKWDNFMLRLNLTELVEIEPKEINDRGNISFGLGISGPDIIQMLIFSFKEGFHLRCMAVAHFATFNLILQRIWVPRANMNSVMRKNVVTNWVMTTIIPILISIKATRKILK